MTATSTTLGVWCVHAPQDLDPYATELQRHLAPLLIPKGLRLVKGAASVDLILLLVSADLKAHLDQGDLRSQLQHQRALGATVIQIIIRPVDRAALLDGRLQILPRAESDQRFAVVDRPRPADRDAVWTEVVREIGHAADRHPRRVALAATAQGPAPPPADRRAELYVRLRRGGPAAVEVSYLIAGPGQQPSPPVTAPLPPVLCAGGAARRGGGAKGAPGGAAPPAVRGEDLFRLLFPDEGAYRPVLRRLFGLPSDDQAVPSRYAARLRLWCDDPGLLALPWHTLASAGFPLCSAMIGWTCEVSPRGPSTSPPRTLLLPGPVLVFAPDARDEPRVRAVESVLRAALPRGAPLRCQVARDPAALARALDGTHGLLYCVGRGDAAGLRCGGAVLPWAELAASLRGAAPGLAIAYLDLDGAPADLAASLIPALPLALQARRPDDLEHLPAFLAGLLRERREPVAQAFRAALARAAGAEDAPLPADAVPALYSHGSLAVYAPEAPPLDDFVPLRLDRDTPRALVRRHVDDLLRSRRVEALLAYAEPGNHLETFVKQALDEVLDNGACHHHRPLHLPARRPAASGDAAPEDLNQELQRLLRVHVGWGGDEDLAKVLRRDFLIDSASTSTSECAVLWLDCGVHSLFKRSHLTGWMDFCRALSRPNVCPDNLRVVVYLALVRHPDEHAALKRQIAALAELGDERLRLSLLPALPAVELGDLRTYLFNRSHCDLPTDLVPTVARQLMEVTDGHYERTVAWLRRARDLGWARVLDELRRAAVHRQMPEDDDE